MNEKRKLLRLTALVVLLALVALMPVNTSLGQAPFRLSDCREIGFSTEEDFITRAGTPADGNPIISDGDLLSPAGRICARNRELVRAFDVTVDVGLDAVDVINIEKSLVAFSTELDSPHGNFTAGDLLTTHGAAVPNQALLAAFGRQPNMGLDSLHFVGTTEAIERFLAYVKEKGRDYWLRYPDAFPGMLREYRIDLWFSIEETFAIPDAFVVLDGDLLSAAEGKIVYSNGDWLAPPIPAGIPERGVDFGLDAFAAGCRGEREPSGFSTEILYRPRDRTPAFTDGDLLAYGGGVMKRNEDLVAAFEPLARMLGLDALTYPYLREQCRETIPGYLPLLLRRYLR